MYILRVKTPSTIKKFEVKSQIETRRPESSFRLISIRNINEKFLEVPECRTSIGNLLNEKLQIESKKPSSKSKTEVPSFNLSLNIINEKFREVPERKTSIGNLLNEKLQIKMQKSKSEVRSQKPSPNSK